MITLQPGHFAVVPGRGGPLEPQIVEIESTVGGMVRFSGWSGRRQIAADAIIATFPSREAAKDLVDGIAGIRGEQDRRIAAARLAAREALDRLAARTKRQ